MSEIMTQGAAISTPSIVQEEEPPAPGPDAFRVGWQWIKPSTGELRYWDGHRWAPVGGKGGGGGGQVYTTIFGLSVDKAPEAAEAAIEAPSGVGELPDFADRHILIFRLAAEADLESVVFYDDSTQDNAIGAFSKFAGQLIPQGETENFNIWISNQLLTHPQHVIMKVR